ncbi:MAG: radical SAM protein [Bacteroidota bacterium]
MKSIHNSKTQKLAPGNIKDYKATFNIKTKTPCNAPFSSLYFTRDGYIKPCCIQYDNYSFGKYPDISIKEALNSKNRKTLQKKLQNNDFSFGCKACFDDIDARNYEAAMSTQYIKYKKQGMPRVLEFALSHYCNLDCIMCDLHTNKKDDNVYDQDFVESLTPYLKKADATRFFGGEPFMIDIYKNIWNKIIKINPGMQVHIQSNGTINNKYIRELLLNMNVFLGISFDAMHKNLYEQIRRGADFNKLMDNIRVFEEITNKHGKPINYSFCPMQINLQEIPEFMDFVNKNHGILFFNTVNWPSSLSLQSMSVEKLVDAENMLLKSRFNDHKNPNGKRNLQKLNHLINYINSIKQHNQKAEKKYDRKPLIDILKAHLEDVNPEAYAFLLSRLSDNQLQKNISPVIQDKLSNMPPHALQMELNNLIRKREIKPFLEFFEINSEL